MASNKHYAGSVHDFEKKGYIKYVVENTCAQSKSI